MFEGVFPRCLLATMLALCVSAPAVAASQATSHALVIRPVTVTKTKDMDFGVVAVTTAGTAVLEPNADAISSTGGVVLAGGNPHSAEFAGAAHSSSVVNIKIPNKPSTLTRVGGTEI